MLVLERGISPTARLRNQDGYCEYMADGTKALVMKKVFSVSNASFSIFRSWEC